MPNVPNLTSIPAPRVPIVDPATGLIATEWYRFLLNLFTLAGSGGNAVSLDDLQLGPPVQESVSSGGGGTGDVVGPGSSTDNALVRFDGTTGKLVRNGLITEDDTGNLAHILSQTFANGSAVTVAAGKQWYDGSTGSWNLGMGGGNITQQVGEELFYYGKASAAITDSPLQIVYKTGVVGASGVITFAPTTTGITDPDLIVGVATEDIAHNAFGRVTTYGIIHGIATNGTAYSETWADGDDIWYNPVTGHPTKTKPSAPNIKVQIGTVINAGPGGSGSFLVRIGSSSTLGGTDSNVQFGTLSGGQIMSYDQTASYWKNINLTPGSGISITPATDGAITIANTSPSSGGTVTSVAMSVPTGLTVTGSPVTTSGTFAVSYTSGYAIPTTASQTNWDTAYSERLQWDGGSTNLVAATGRSSLGGTTVGQNFFTLTNPSAITFPRINADNSISALSASAFRTAIGAGTGDGTVTAVSGTAPIASSGGTTPAISISQATTSTDGYLSSTDWNTFNNKQPAGTYVNSVGATSPVASSGGTNPTISMPQATGSVSGYLSSTDWTTFNNKQPAGTYVTSVGATSPVASSGGTTPTISMPQASGSVSGYLSSTDWTTFNSKGTGTVTSVTGTSPIASSGGTTPAISISQASGSTNGYLSSTDWTTFNNKQPAGTYVTSVTGTSPITSSGGTTPALSLASGYGDTQNPYASKTANYMLAAPNGSSGAPTFRAMVAADLPNTAVTPGSYTTANITVDAQGRITAAANGTGGSNITTYGMWENAITIGANYSVTSGNNSVSAGPITVSTGVTVTVPSGSVWTIV